MSENDRVISMPPVVGERPTILVLGSMPGKASLLKQQYYGHPRNHFWPLMFDLFEEAPTDVYTERIAIAKKHGIALWDVLASCERAGSLDSQIKKEQPNDLVSFVEHHPSLRLIACNGGKAFQSFQRHAGQVQTDRLTIAKLPSTSPTPGKNVKTYAEKKVDWQELLQFSR
ncbi:DNA-deoxyinosine glycosylase [Bacillaceae bacterium SIJ1]|uniref:DNA-deoxyinosine glycosylase n=1 Tax=Litoribacterium kuwaitense TaxID=1398745 RepID=UPI0013EE2579|nr:DNA-deoxyinosine glycosylase [Litoribacterium kuwaitense]NGP46404.1 DNA-deoxyinosine glycosylase [Litoribacterium kuwaitense]